MRPIWGYFVDSYYILDSTTRTRIALSRTSLRTDNLTLNSCLPGHPDRSYTISATSYMGFALAASLRVLI